MPVNKIIVYLLTQTWLFLFCILGTLFCKDVYDDDDSPPETTHFLTFHS